MHTKHQTGIYSKIRVVLLAIAILFAFSTKIDAAQENAPGEWKSLNPGISVSPSTPLMPPNNQLFSMFSFHDKLYVSTNSLQGGLWTYDNGTWTKESSPPAIVMTMVDLDGVLYAGTYDNANPSDGIWTYRNGNWTQMIGSPGSVTNMVLDTASGTIYAASYAESQDIWSYRNGEWSRMDGSPSHVDEMVFMNGTLYVRTLEGDLWTYHNDVWTTMEEAPQNIVDIIEVGGTLDVLSENGWEVWSYANETWTQMPSLPGYMDFLANVNGKLYVDSYYDDNLLLYTGQEWESIPKSSNLTTSLVGANGVLYQANLGSISAYDNGNWTTISGMPSYATSLAYIDDYALYAGTYGGDGSDLWLYRYGAPYEQDLLGERQQIRVGPANVTSMASIKGISRDTLYVGTMNGTFDVWKSVAGSWEQIEDSPSGVQMLVSIQDTLYAGTLYFGLWSYDGTSWTQMSEAPDNVVSMVQIGDTLYAGSGNEGNSVYAYRDGNWTQSPGSPGRAVALANWKGTLYAGSANGAVYALSNGEWTRTNNSPDNIRSLVELNGKLYAGTWNGGNDVWAYDGTTWTQMPGSPSNILSLLSVEGTLYTAGESGVNGITLYTPPGAPTAVTATAGDGQVTISFTVPDNDGGTSITGYEVTSNVDPDLHVIGTSSPITITGLANNRYYVFGVKAINGVGSSEEVYSNSVKPVSSGGSDTPAPGGEDDTPTTSGGGDTPATSGGSDTPAPGGDDDTPTTSESGDTPTFSDIAGHWAEANIKKAVSDGIVKGYSDGTFKPNRTVTRAEFAVMLMNALKPQEEGAALAFADTDKIGSWAKKAVAQAVSLGIINGYADGSFHPDAEITRVEMAAMIAKAMGQPLAANASTGFADDKDIPAWAKGAVGFVKLAGIMKGKGDNEFAAQDHTTRAEAVTVLLNMLAQIKK
jgi:Fibronectin type III domain./S-layer homology domain.